MKKVFFPLFLLSCGLLNAQFITTPDTAICFGESATLIASGGNITPSLVNTDDVHSGVIPIGFDFNFYGNTYNECLISANGYFTFDLDQANQYSPWPIDVPIPNPNNLPENAIMAPWHDIDPSIGGNIIYGTYGAAPNRVFYVVWCGMPMYSCNNLIAGQYIQIFEHSNKIEMHIDEKPLCIDWNNGNAIQGLVNENSTLFEIVDDPVLLQPRNFPLQWTATDEGWEFIPNANFDDYTVNQIAYNPIATGTVVWTDQFGNQVGNGLETTVTPPVGQNYYFITVEDVCTGETIYNVDTVLVDVAPPTNAGLDSVVFLCDDISNQVDLNTFLSTNSDVGGSWFLDTNTTNPYINVNESSSGIYNYITYGLNANCNDTSTINLTINALPDAGVEGLRLVCAGYAEFSLFDELNGNPDVGGIWLNENSVQVSDIFDPATSPVGEYTYFLQGLNACPSDSQKVIINYQQGFNIETFATPVTCQGYDDGSITIIAENSTISPIVYSIDGGTSFVSYYSFQNLDYGDYNVVVKDGVGCITEEEVTVLSSQPPISVYVAGTDVVCHGDSTSTIFVETISGGNITTGYTYTWFTSGTNQVIGTDSSVQVPVGGYYLVVEDDNGCQGTDEVSVEEPNQLTFDIDRTEISCQGSSDGSAQVTVTGGATPPYTLSWSSPTSSLFSFSNSSTTPTTMLSNVGVGSYVLEVIDSNNCVESLSLDFNEPSVALSLSVDVDSITCFGSSSGIAQATVNGGLAPYSYQWSSGHITPIANNLSSGDYEVLVTDSRGCMVSDSVKIDSNPEIILTLTSTPTTCYGDLDGSASVSASGGSGTLTYLWSTNEPGDSIISKPFGEYWVKVEDDLGCYVIDTIQIGQPLPFKVQLLTNDVKCYGGSDGSISSIVSGGTPFSGQPYTYSWSDANGSIGSDTSAIFSLSSSVSAYSLEITDANGCVSSSSTFISEPTPLTLDSNNIESSYCLNIPSGKASVLASGGYLDYDSYYTFLWNTGDTTAFIDDQLSGFYEVVVKDDNHCTDTLELYIPLDETFVVEMTTEPLSCYGDGSGLAIASTEGGFGPYTYDWNTPSGVFQTMNVSSVDSLSNLSSGVTSVVVTDVNGCAKTKFASVEEPSELLFSIFKISDESCTGDVSSCDGELVLSAVGGTGTYMYYHTQGTLSDTLYSDTSVTVSDLCSGDYSVFVEDERGCVGVTSGSGLMSPVSINTGLVVTSSINTSAGAVTNNILCYGDTLASMSALNPNTSFDYHWYVNGSYFTSGTSAMLPAGDIELRAEYGSCYTTSSPVSIYQPSQIVLTDLVSSVSCFGGTDGSISVDASGGTPFYDYAWYDGSDSLLSTGVTSLNDLSSGDYELIVTDANNCDRSFSIYVDEPLALSGTSVDSDASCWGGSDGSSVVTVSGGTSPYVIDWQGVDSTSLSAGSYPVLLTDANLCSSTLNVSIGQPSAIVADFDVNSTPFVAQVSGGTPSYSYAWLYFGSSQGSSSTYSPSMGDGDYTLLVTDANGCEKREMKMYTGTVGVVEEESTEVLIYPNPAQDYFVIEVVGANQQEEYELKIIDSRGRTVHEKLFEKTLKVESRNLSAGIYLLRLKNNSTITQRKILISDLK